nr:MAG TPA: hypothetical protein [Caudoviricetes sp.]
MEPLIPLTRCNITNLFEIKQDFQETNFKLI